MSLVEWLERLRQKFSYRTTDWNGGSGSSSSFHDVSDGDSGWALDSQADGDSSDSESSNNNNNNNNNNG